jgi:hypothetical protein
MLWGVASENLGPIFARSHVRLDFMENYIWILPFKLFYLLSHSLVKLEHNILFQ